jgi:hypothetical protein
MKLLPSDRTDFFLRPIITRDRSALRKVMAFGVRVCA